ncbi:MAG: hypothetical protein P8J70_11125 [Glaciecola sp.]|jgi:hypothetical protein|nr:hypothetical protein [Glaciecola sp.]MDG1816301.1 hypothetical protein [Glaciecola sp.]MDG2100213.1 hypothetical protein [Glaciecola sp.]
MRKNKFYRSNRALAPSTSRRRLMLKRTHQKMLQRRKLFNLFNFDAETSEA